MCRPPARVLLDRKLTEAPKERQEAVRSEWNNDSVVGAPVDSSKAGSYDNPFSKESTEWERSTQGEQLTHSRQAHDSGANPLYSLQF